MLVLSRRPGDAVVIDGDIRVVVLEDEGGTVRLGIEAPPEVDILREEIVQEVARENLRASARAGTRAWLDRLSGEDGAEAEGGGES